MSNRAIRCTLRFQTSTGAPASDYGSYVIAKTMKIDAGRKLGEGLYDCALSSDEIERLADGPFLCAGGSVRI